MMFPWFPELSVSMIEFVLENTIAISLFGFAFLTIGITFLANLIISGRHKHYRIKSGTNSVLVDEHLIQQYLEKYWENIFPDHEISNHLQLKNNRICLHADLPYLPLEEQRPLLQRIEKDLTNIFSKVLGYHQEFFLYASFQPKSN